MIGDPTPHEHRSTNDTLNILRSILYPDGPFHERLLSSFRQAQNELILQRINTGETLPIKYQQIFDYDPQTSNGLSLMQELFNRKLELIRSERPVILVNIKQLAQEKNHLIGKADITYEDLLSSVSSALSTIKQYKKNENGLFPAISARFIPIDEREDYYHFFPDTKVNAELAFIWGDTGQSGSELNAFEALMLRLSDSQYKGTISILLPKTATEVQRFGSLWVPKLRGEQLSELNPNEISLTVSRTWSALNKSDPNKIRVVIRPYGTGKTRMLEELREKLATEGISEVTFINGAEGLVDMQALNGSVIFVDEAANLDIFELTKKIKGDSRIILFYPTEDSVKEKMPESKWPRGSYTLIV